jgi:hypothetical protein
MPFTRKCEYLQALGAGLSCPEIGSFKNSGRVYVSESLQSKIVLFKEKEQEFSALFVQSHFQIKRPIMRSVFPGFVKS